MGTENIFETGLIIAGGLGIVSFYILWFIDTYKNWSNDDKDTFDIVGSFLVGWMLGGIVGAFAYIMSPLLILVGIVSLIRRATSKKVVKDDYPIPSRPRPSRIPRLYETDGYMIPHREMYEPEPDVRFNKSRAEAPLTPTEDDFNESWTEIFGYPFDECTVSGGFHDSANTGFSVNTPKGSHIHGGFGEHNENPRVEKDEDLYYSGCGCTWDTDLDGLRYDLLDKATGKPYNGDGYHLEVIRRYVAIGGAGQNKLGDVNLIP